MAERRRFVPELSPRQGSTTTGVRDWTDRQLRRLRNYLLQIEEVINRADEHAGNTPNAAHVPPGGTVNQVLAKVSGTDYDTEWQNPSVNSIGEEVPGTGNVWDDINVHCFDGYWSDGACRICIGQNDICWFGHNGILYKWFGPNQVCLGSGGAGGVYPHYLATSEDLVAIGSTDHSALSNRSIADQHPQAAITDLVTDQSAQDSRLTALEAHPPRTDNPHQVSHTQLPDKGANTHAAIDAHLANLANPHQVTHIQLPDRGSNTHAQIDTELVRLEQDKLDIADAVATFTFAAYGNLEAPVDSAFPNLGLIYQKIDILTAPGVDGRGITLDRPNSTFAFQYDGVYRMSVGGAFEHNESNQGRETYIRLYDETDGAALGAGLIIPTGRNQPASQIATSFIFEIDATLKGHVFSLEIGGGSTYSAVSFQQIGLDINAVSEWREPLG